MYRHHHHHQHHRLISTQHPQQPSRAVSQACRGDESRVHDFYPSPDALTTAWQACMTKWLVHDATMHFCVCVRAVQWLIHKLACIFSRPPLGVYIRLFLQKKLFIGTQAVNFRPSTDRHEIFTHNSRGGRAHNLKFEILIFDPQKIWRGKTPQISTNLAERPSIGNS